MPRGRKPSKQSCRKGDRIFCPSCCKEIIWVLDFFFDPTFSPYAHHNACVERIMRHRGLKAEEHQIVIFPRFYRQRFTSKSAPSG